MIANGADEHPVSGLQAGGYWTFREFRKLVADVPTGLISRIDADFSATFPAWHE